MSYEHAIGATLETLTDLLLLSTAVIYPRSRYRDAAAQKVAVSGATLALGEPQADWEWTYLTMDMRNQLRAFCPGASANVYIRALKNDGSYANFSAIVHWPAEEQRSSQYTLNLVLSFTHLVEIPAV